MKYVGPGETFPAFVNGFPSGLATVRVRITDAAGVEVFGPTTAGVVEVEAGSGTYGHAALVAPSDRGTYLIGWDTGTVSTSTWTTEDLVVGSSAPVVSPGPGALCTRADVKAARRGPTTGAAATARDDLIDALILDASAAIARYAGRRQFIADLAPSTRTFEIVGPVVDIGDLSAAPSLVTVGRGWGAAVATVAPVTGYRTLPMNPRPDQPITMIELGPATSSRAGVLAVTGVWGFPQIPRDIRQAAIEAVVEWLKSDEGLTRPSPDQFEPGAPPERGLPLKSRDLVRPYIEALVA